MGSVCLILCNMDNFKYALFDLDGTLLDTEDQYTVFWDRIGARFRPDVPNIAERIKGTTLVSTFERFFPRQEDRVEIKRLMTEFEACELQYEFYPGALDFLADLRRNGVRQAVVTSSNSIKMASVCRRVPGFGDLFDRILTADDFSESKPSPDCYLKAAASFGAAKGECVVFEDAYSGLQAGMSAGIFTVGLATGHTREEIEDRCNLVLEGYEGLSLRKLTEMICATK